MPRFRIALIMLIVAITALALGAIRAISDFESRSLFLLCAVVIPMASILAVGLLLAFLRPRSRRFLKGFEGFGVMGLIFVTASAIQAKDLVELYLAPPMALYEQTIGWPPMIGEIDRLMVGFCFLSLWATWPQLAIALMGGFLSRALEPPDDPTELAAKMSGST